MLSDRVLVSNTCSNGDHSWNKPILVIPGELVGMICMMQVGHCSALSGHNLYQECIMVLHSCLQSYNGMAYF